MLILEYIGVGIAVVTFIGGIFAWYSAVVRKEYASQRDWEHLKNNQRLLNENLNFLFKDIEQNIESMRNEHDKRFDKIDAQGLELKGMFYASLANRKRKNEDVD